MSRARPLSQHPFILAGLCALGAALLCTGDGRADLVYAYTGSSGNQAGAAFFSLTGNTLTLTLANKSMADVQVPANVLTGLAFNTTHTLTPVSASLNGSTVYYGTTTNPGDGWGYASGVSAQGKNSAVSASGAINGLGHSNFSAANNQIKGLDYGLLSLGDNTATGNTGVTGHGPLIKNSIKFTFTVGPDFSLSELGQSAVFQYGTTLADTNFAGSLTIVPAPPSGMLLAVGGSLTACAGWLRRRLRAA